MNNLEALAAIAKDIRYLDASVGRCYSTGECCPHSDGNLVLIKNDINADYSPFDPENNPAQAEEIQMYYKIGTSPCAIDDLWLADYYKDNEIFIRVNSKTPSAAITACAIEIKQQEK